MSSKSRDGSAQIEADQKAPEKLQDEIHWISNLFKNIVRRFKQLEDSRD